MTYDMKDDTTYEETLTACVTAWERHQWQKHETLKRELEEALMRQHQTKSQATEIVRRDLQRMQISLRTAYRGVLYTTVAEYTLAPSPDARKRRTETFSPQPCGPGRPSEKTGKPSNTISGIWQGSI